MEEVKKISENGIPNIERDIALETNNSNSPNSSTLDKEIFSSTDNI